MTHATVLRAVAVVTAVLLTSAGCQTSAEREEAPLPAGAEPILENLGQEVLRYRDRQMWVVLEYQYASMNPGEEWLILDVTATAARGEEAVIHREDIFVRTPDGERVPVADQGEFARAFSSLRSHLVRANIVGDRLMHLPASRRPCRFQFFVEPGTRIAYSEVSVDDRRGCWGRLFFEVPGGVQPGRWIFGMDLEETDVRIPFTIG